VESTKESRKAFLIGREWSFSFSPLSLSEVSDNDIMTNKDSMAMLLFVRAAPLGNPPVIMAVINANTITTGLLLRIRRTCTPGK
jgi:hypothetical protein